MQLANCGEIQAISMSSCNRYLATVDARDGQLRIYNTKRQKSLLPTKALEAHDNIDVAWSKRAKDLRLATITQNEVIFWHPANVTQMLRQKGVLDEQRFEATTYLSVCFDSEGWCYSGGDNGQI